MRAAFLGIASILAASALADPLAPGALGTRPSPAAYEASPVGAAPILQLVLALALVGAAVKFALPWLVKRFGGRLTTDLNGSIRIEESAAFAGGRLYVVEARGRTLLLGATGQSVSCLADLTVSDFAEALAQAEEPAANPRVAIESQLMRLERLGR